MKKYAIVSILLVSTIFFTSCTKNEDVIKLALKPMTEQLIIGAMFNELIEENTDLELDITEGVGGGTLNIHPSLLKGQFDLYPEYTGTGWNSVLKEESGYTEDKFVDLQEGYKKFGLTWDCNLGFNNTYGIGIRKDLAIKYNLKNISDLKDISSSLIFGGEFDFFEREDGYNLLCDKYGLNFQETADLDIGLKYDAISQGEVDVINIFTTDGRITDSNITVLYDDLQLYPSYTCYFVIRDEVLEEYPEIKDVFNILENTLSESIMAELNYKVEVLGEDYNDVAYDFLTDNGLVK